MAERFTLVLKGPPWRWPACAPSRDDRLGASTHLARAPLWSTTASTSTFDGTGHGVGSYLRRVHEGPQRISKACPTPSP